MSVTLKEILTVCEKLLDVDQFDDYCPNGLQVEGAAQVTKIISGVTASYALLEEAVKQRADMVLVHHGYFWKGDDRPIVGLLRRRLELLIKHNISLVVFHLPLDAHSEIGNNVLLARHLNIIVTGKLNNTNNLGLVGELPTMMSGEQLAEHINSKLGRNPLHIPGSSKPIKKIAWCTGAAQGFIEQAVHAGVDAYITGEISEATTHIARESGIHFFAAGHHATERFGIHALGDVLATTLGVEHNFIDIYNPV